MRGILSLAVFRPLGFISIHAVIVFVLGENLLFKSVLGHCDSICTVGLFLNEKLYLLCMMDIVYRRRSSRGKYAGLYRFSDNT